MSTKFSSHYNFSTFCLHAGADGKSWKAETGKEDAEFFSARSRIEPGTYRVIGVKQNYRLIAEVFPLLKNVPDTYFLVGSPHICSQYSCDADRPEEVLTCVRSLSVCDSLVNCWHRINLCSFSTFMLLQFFLEEGLGTKTKILYAHHPLKPYFDFIGFSQEHLAISFIDEIVDPRWYLNLQRPQRLSKLESYFGLKEKQFCAITNDPRLIPRSPLTAKKLHLLTAIVKSLPENSCIRKEHAIRVKSKHLSIEQQQLSLLKTCFGFLVRHWLQALDSSMVFDPEKFFSDTVGIIKYQKTFG